MYKLTFKVPLRIHMKVSLGFGDGYRDVLLSELDTKKIHGMENLYDCYSETDAFYAMLQRDAFKAGAEWMVNKIK